MSIDLLKKKLEKYETITTDVLTKHTDWIRTLLTLTTTLLGILVAFGIPKESGDTTKIIFIVTLSLLGLCILLGAIQIYAEVRMTKSMQARLHQSIKEHADGKDQSFIESIETPLFYEVTEIIYYIFLVLSLCSVVFYGIIATL